MTVDTIMTLINKVTHFYESNASGIQHALIEHLTTGQYETFCRVSLRYAKDTPPQKHFKVEMLQNPYNDEDALTDKEIVETWKLSRLIDAIKESL